MQWSYLCDATIHVFGTPAGKLGRNTGPHSCSMFSGIVHVSNCPAASARMHGPRHGGATETVNATLKERPPRSAAAPPAPPGGD